MRMQSDQGLQLLTQMARIANPSRPSVRLTALDEPTITKILMSRKISGEIINIYSLLKGKIKICSFPLEKPAT